MVYQWKKCNHCKGSAQVAGEICEQLEKAGQLSAKNLLDVSRPEDAPLHDSFEWDDSVAAERYREDQAREIIRSIVIVPEKSNPVRGFFKIESAEPTYQSIQSVLQNEDSTQKLLATAFRELSAIQNKYASLRQLNKVWEAVEAAKAQPFARNKEV